MLRRKDNFAPIYQFLLKNGLDNNASKDDIVEFVTDKYSKDIAQNILDLWFAKNDDNTSSIYYEEDVAFAVACENLLEKMNSSLDIYRYNNEKLNYKESQNSKYVVTKIGNKSIDFFLKNYIYFLVTTLIGYMAFIIYSLPVQDNKDKYILFGYLSGVSLFLFYQSKNIFFNKSFSQKVVSYLFLGLSGYIFYRLYYISTMNDILKIKAMISDIFVTTILLFFVSKTKVEQSNIVDIIKSIIKWIGTAFIIVLLFAIYNNHNKTTKPKGEESNIKKHSSSHSSTSDTKLHSKVVDYKCQYYMPTTALNVRQERTKNSKKIGYVRKLQKLCITNKEDGWSYIKSKGWVDSKYLEPYRKVIKRAKKRNQVVPKKKRHISIWHCSAKSVRASGWAEDVNKNKAISSALHQCEIRRVSPQKCQIVNCYTL